MGQKPSKLEPPEKPGCVFESGVRYVDAACNIDGGTVNNNITNVYPAPLVVEDASATLVRLYIGSHETKPMGGSLPSVAIFNEFGQRLGQHESKVQSTAPGGFKDVVVKHAKGLDGIRPSYLLMHGGDQPICITAVAMEYPDGAKQFFTGADISLCNRVPTSTSRTFFGPEQDQPECFWLGGAKADKNAIHRLSLHVPDYTYTKARYDAYLANEQLACRRTPRFWSETYSSGMGLSYPIPIFNPVIEYDRKTHFDKHPNRVLSWALPKVLDGKDISDVPFNSRPAYIDKTTMRGGSYQHDVDSDPDFGVLSLEPFVDGQVEEEQIRVDAPQLVISEKDISAVEQCRWGRWNHTDYVSLSEQIYCDMQGRSMFPLCTEEINRNCWNQAANQLQGLGPVEQTTFNGFSAASDLVSWGSTGPLFGYAYPNVATIG